MNSITIHYHPFVEPVKDLQKFICQSCKKQCCSNTYTVCIATKTSNNVYKELLHWLVAIACWLAIWKSSRKIYPFCYVVNSQCTNMRAEQMNMLLVCVVDRWGLYGKESNLFPCCHIHNITIHHTDENHHHYHHHYSKPNKNTLTTALW